MNFSGSDQSYAVNLHQSESNTTNASGSTGMFGNLRSLISLVDELRDVGLSRYMNLPRICVVGSQSAGKSSVLESVVGYDFLPRGEGVCTRRPLELRLVHVSEGACVFPDEVKHLPLEERVWAEFADVDNVWGGHMKRLFKFSDVKKTIEQLTDNVAGSNKGIVDSPIVLSIFGSACPDLTLVDLPGVTRVPLRNSDQKEDIEKLTRQMSLRYANDPLTVILAVIPANADLTTSDALALARMADPKGERTIGVVTKLDLMDRGVDARKVLMGEDYRLSLGYVAVRNRNQQQIIENMSVRDALGEERDWFSRHPVYNQLPSYLLGTNSLIDKLTKVLLVHIQQHLPLLRRDVTERKKKIESRLEQLGTHIPHERSEQTHLVWTLVHEFSALVNNAIKGKLSPQMLHNLQPQANVNETTADSSALSISSFMGSFKTLFGDTSNESSAFNYDSEDPLLGGSTIRMLFQSFLKDLAPSSSTQPSAMWTDDAIERALKIHQGDALPGFPSPDTFEFLLLPMLSRLKAPAVECLETAAAVMDRLLERAGQLTLFRFPSLKDAVVFHSQEIVEKEKDYTKRVLEDLVDAEINYLFTNDAEYLNTHGKSLSQFQQEQQRQQQQQLSSHPMQQPPQGPQLGSKSNGLSNAQQPQSLQSQQQLQQQQTAARKMTVMDELRARLDAYYQLVWSALRDSVPRIIGQFLVRKTQQSLQLSLVSKMTDTDSLLNEPLAVKEERRSLNQQLSVLTNACSILQRDPTSKINDMLVQDPAATFVKLHSALRPTPTLMNQSSSPVSHLVHTANQNNALHHSQSQLFSQKPLSPHQQQVPQSQQSQLPHQPQRQAQPLIQSQPQQHQSHQQSQPLPLSQSQQQQQQPNHFQQQQQQQQQQQAFAHLSQQQVPQTGSFVQQHQQPPIIQQQQQHQQPAQIQQGAFVQQNANFLSRLTMATKPNEQKNANSVPLFE